MEDDPDKEADDLPSMIGAISEEIDEEVTDTSDESEAEEMVVTTSQRDKYNISAQGDGAIETQVTADSGFNIQLPSFQGEGTGAIAQTENPAAAFEEFRGTAAPREQDDERLYTGSSHTDFRPADLPPRESLEKDASLEPAAVYGDETSPLDKAPSPEEDYRWDLFLVGNKNKKKKGKAVETEPDFIHSDAREKPHGTDKVRTSASDPAPQVVVEGGEPKHRQDEDSIESKRERPARSGSQDEQTSNPVGPSVWSIREADEAVAKFVEEEVYMIKKEQEQRDEEEYRNFIRMQEEKKAANESVQGKGKERLGEASYHGLMEEQTEAHGRILAKAGHEQEEEEEEEDAKRKPLIEEEKPEFEQEQRKREDEAKADKGESLRIVLEAQARRAKNLREGKIPEEMVGKEEAVLAEAALEEAMRKRLAQFGFQENQIQAMIHPEQQQKLEKNTGLTPHNPLRIAPQPTYAKVRREYLDIETLHYYDLPYEYDVDPNYIIVLREMNQKEMDVLFEHTRRLRSNHGDRLFIEADGRDRRGKKEYAFVRRKSRTRGTDAEDRDTEPR
ncbi:hypothetical protein SLS59_002280 [Nothophoma quercina]|uniref:Uncharacterized protein n=1 Tax=Nothophoma quercina TaxID=749835 RepID=A0ABR3RSA7_9PLEO